MLTVINAYKRRVLVLVVLLMSGFGFIIGRLYYIQVYRHEHYLNLALKQQVTKVVIAPRRGDIMDRTGKVLATSAMLHSLYCDPTLIKKGNFDVTELSRRLASILYKPQEKIYDALTREKGRGILLSRQISPEQVKEVESVIKEFHLPRYALFFRKEAKRIYPYGKLLAPVLGYAVLDKFGDNKGMAGLEYQYDKYLRGGTPKIITARGASRVLLDYFPEELLEKSCGASLVLSIDESIQYVAEKELAETLALEKADAGCVTVMDIPTGEILAMASLPSFDPNDYEYYPLELRRNNAISAPIQPGSVMKIFTFATLLENNLLDVQEPVDCGSGNTVYFNGRAIRDAPGHPMGVVPAYLAFYYSSNVGTARLAERLENEIMYAHLHHFGFGRKTGIDLPGEDDGILRPVTEWSLLSKTSLAIGYEIAVTSLQIAQAVSAIANNGYLMRPYVVRKVVNSRGEILFENRPRTLWQVVRPSVAEQMLELMEGVVLYGTGQKAQIPGYRVGGKTGTALKPPYKEKKYIASFVGVVPIDSPRICIYVWIDNPKRHHYGGDVAAPVFKNVAEAALKVLHIPPSEEIKPTPTPYPLLAEEPNSADDTSPVQAESKSQSSSLPKGVMPDLTGLTMREALKQLTPYKVTPQFVGSGVVIDQMPQAGKRITPGARCLLIFGDNKTKSFKSAQLLNKLSPESEGDQ